MKKNILTLALFASFFSYADEQYVIRVPHELNIGEWVFQDVEYDDWTDISGAYACSEWTPEPSEVEVGVSFKQEMSCSHDMERNVYQYKINSITGDKILETKSTEFETKQISNFRDEVGTLVKRNMCIDILNNGNSNGDGIYTVDPDGEGGEAARDAYCDMSGGGWTLFDSFGTKLIKTGDVNPPAYNGNNINSGSSLTASGYIYWINNINNGKYYTSPYYMQFFYGSSPRGYIERNLPDWIQGVRVSASNEWYAYAGYIRVGDVTKSQPGYRKQEYLDFQPGDSLRMTETGIYWVDSVWVK